MNGAKSKQIEVCPDSVVLCKIARERERAKVKMQFTRTGNSGRINRLIEAPQRLRKGERSLESVDRRSLIDEIVQIHSSLSELCYALSEDRCSDHQAVSRAVGFHFNSLSSNLMKSLLTVRILW